MLRLVSTFLQDYRSTSRQAPRLERILAFGRAFLAVSALAAIYFDPTEPARFATFTYSFLAVYAFYSLALLAVMRWDARLIPARGVAIHAVDILCASVMTFFSEGPLSPLFLFFLFVLLAAAYRWGFRETMATAAVAVAVFLGQIGAATIGPWRDTWFAGMTFELTPVTVRVAYLLLTGFLLGYLAEQEKQFRAEIAATADAMRQPRAELGLAGNAVAVGRFLQRIFQARAVDVVVHDHEAGRTLLWHLATPDHPEPAEDGLELDQRHRDAWLAESPARVWCTGPRFGGADRAFILDESAWSVRDVGWTVPAAFTDAREYAGLMAVDLRFAGDWQGRVYLFDPAETRDRASRLHFLGTLIDYITPVLSNVVLLRRLRSRAGAAERARVARELHDGAIQGLIGIQMQVEALRRQVEPNASGLADELAHLHGVIHQEVIALRELMQELRPVDLDAGQQLPETLSALVERFRRDTGVATRFVSRGRTTAVPLRTAVEIVRIVQEALVNVRKHSRARSVVVRLAEDATPGTWRLSVEDDGHGFEFEGRLTGAELDVRRVGPAIIKERVGLIGGELTIDSSPDRGARVEVAFDVGS